MPNALLSSLPADLQDRLNSARELTRLYGSASAPPVLLPTKIEGLDELLTGGLYRGQMVELIGHRSSGRFSTVLSLLAVITGAGEAAALIDLGNNLDPGQAVLSGIDLRRLLWIQPREIKEALISAETLLVGGFPFVAIDLGTPPVAGGRGNEAAWLRLARAASSQAAVIFVSSPYRVSGTAAAGVMKASRGRPLWTSHAQGARRETVPDGGLPRLLAGLTSHLSVEKLRGRHDGDRIAKLRFLSHEASTFAMAR